MLRNEVFNKWCMEICNQEKISLGDFFIEISGVEKVKKEVRK